MELQFASNKNAVSDMKMYDIGGVFVREVTQPWPTILYHSLFQAIECDLQDLFGGFMGIGRIFAHCLPDFSMFRFRGNALC